MNIDEIKNKCNFRPAKSCATCFWCSNLYLTQYICRKNGEMLVARHMICDKYLYNELADKALRVRHECCFQNKEQCE